MIFSDLSTRIAAILHRTDLAPQMVNFAADATDKINTRFTLSLTAPVAPADTNTVLTDSPLLYLYASLESAYEFLNNGENAVYYADKFAALAAEQNITGGKSSTDPYLIDPPQIKGV